MDAFDFILLSYDKGLINDNDFLLLCRSYVSQKLDLPLSCFYNGLQVLQLEFQKQNKITLIKSSISARVGCS